MYDNMAKLPPHEVAMIETPKDTYVEIPMDGSGPLFVTVMPFDAHGQKVGKVLYLMSQEIRLDPKVAGASSAAGAPAARRER